MYTDALTALLILSLKIRYLTIKGALMCIRLQVTWVVSLYADITAINPMESAVGFRSMSKYWTAGLAVKKMFRAFVVRFLKPKARAYPRAAGKRTQRLFSLLRIPKGHGNRFLPFHRRLINASVSLFTFKWH